MMNNAPLVRERSRVQFSPAAPFSDHDYKALGKRGASRIVAERRKNAGAYVARNWQDLPESFGQCALYRYFDDEGCLIYIGISAVVRERARAHRCKPWHYAARILCLEAFPCRATAEMAESLAIAAEDPICNSQRRFCSGASAWRYADYIKVCGGLLRGYAWDAFILPRMPRPKDDCLPGDVTLYEAWKRDRHGAPMA